MTFLGNLLEAVFVEWVIIGLAAALGLLVVWLDLKRVSWTVPLVLGGVTVASVLAAWYVVRMHSDTRAMRVAIDTLVASQQPLVTVDNVEEMVRQWAVDLGYGVQRQPNPPDPAAHFIYSVTLASGVTVYVSHSREAKHLLIHTPLVLNPDQRKAMDALPYSEQRRLAGEVSIELAKATMQWEIEAYPLRRITIMNHVPINAALSEDVFATSLGKVNNMRIAVNEMIGLGTGTSK